MAPLRIRPCRDTARVMQAVQGHWLSACLGVLMKLKIPEILASPGENTMSFSEVRSVAPLPIFLCSTLTHVCCPNACLVFSVRRLVRHGGALP